MLRSTKQIFAVFLTLCVSGCFGARKDVSAYIVRARDYVSSGNRAKAEVELRNALQLNPTDPQANLSLAKLEDESGNLQAAVPHYLRAASPDAHLIEPQLRIVEVLIDSDRLQEAAGRINLAVASFPGDASALALRADLDERNGQVGAAKTDVALALQKDAANARALAVLATLELRNGNDSGALGILDRGLAKHPENLRLLQVQAAALLTAKQPDKAIAALRSIIKMAPGNIEVQTALAEIEANNGKFDEALANFKGAVKADPSNQNLQFAFIKFLAGRSKNDDVVDQLESLIRQFPDAITYDLALAGFYHGKGMLDKSMAVLERAETRLGSSSDLAAVKVALAKVKETAGDRAGAFALLNEVLAGNVQDKDALQFRAEMNMHDGRTSSAIEDLAAVVRIDPVNQRAFQALAGAYISDKEPKLAVEAMKRAVASVPGDENAQLQLASFLENAGDTDGARDLMARMTLRHPEMPVVWIADGQIAIDRKDWAAVSRDLSRVRDLPSGSGPAVALEGQMRAARGDNVGAMRDYRASIESRTDLDPTLLVAFGRASIAAGKPGEAAQYLTQRIPALEKAIQQQAWRVVMTLEGAAGHEDRAEQAFDRAAALAPKDPSVYSGYVGILVGAKKFEEAKKVVATGLVANAPKSELLLLRGWIEETAGDPAAAENSYKEASDANPQAIQAANNHASILADHQPKNRAGIMSARARLNGLENSRDPSIVDTIAWLDYRLGRFDEAKNLLTRINAGESQNPQIRFHMAAVLLAAGDKSAGSALLATVKGLTFPGAAEAQTLSDS